MGPFRAVATCLRKYADFSGRARRSEYWWFTVLFFLPPLLAPFSIPFWIAYDHADHIGMITALADSLWAYVIFWVVLFLPHLSVTARRLHDMNASAWWMLIMLTGIGNVVLFVWVCFRGTPGPNRFGPDPLADDVRSR